MIFIRNCLVVYCRNSRYYTYIDIVIMSVNNDEKYYIHIANSQHNIVKKLHNYWGLGTEDGGGGGRGGVGWCKGAG